MPHKFRQERPRAAQLSLQNTLSVLSFLLTVARVTGQGSWLGTAYTAVSFALDAPE
eukprot:SAG11_NODE_17537_length_515_cov_1.389423_1_plen_55_part_10